MKSTTLIVLGGLLFAGTSLAAEPQQIQHDDTTQAASSGSKVGIDPKTGKLRRLNAIESAQLDAIAARNQKAMPAKAKGKTCSAPRQGEAADCPRAGAGQLRQAQGADRRPGRGTA